jgi:cytochrome P450
LFKESKNKYISDNTWRTHRKIINTTFNAKILQSFVPIFIEKSEKLIASLAIHENGKEFDLIELAMNCSMETVFGELILRKSQHKLLLSFYFCLVTTLGAQIVEKDKCERGMELVKKYFSVN